MRPDALTTATAAVATMPMPDLLAGCALVRCGSEAHVERLQRLGGRIEARGHELRGLVIAGDGEPDREGALAGLEWVIVRTMGGQRVLVVMRDNDNEAEEEGGRPLCSLHP